MGWIRAFLRRRPRAGGEKAAPSGLRRVGRVCGQALGLCVVLLTLAGVAIGVFMFRLSQGPIAIGGVSDRIAAELGAKLGHGYRVEIGASTLERSGNNLKLSLAGLSVVGADNKPVFVAPRAQASLALAPLLIGSLKPTRLELFDVELRLTALENGALALSAGADPILLTPPSSAAPPAVNPDGQVVATPVAPVAAFAPVAGAVADILKVLADGASPISQMQRVGLSGGRLIFKSDIAGEEVTFNNVDLAFERSAGQDSLVLAADGPSSRWEARAHAGATSDSQRSFQVELSNLSFDELALAAGMRAPDFFFDNPLSATVEVGLDEAGAVRTLNGRFEVGSGVFFTREEDFEPLRVDRINGSLRWDAANQRIDVESIEWAAHETRIGIAGSISPPSAANGPWRLDLRTQPGSALGREFPGDTPVPLDNMRLLANFNPSARNFALETLEAKGPELNISMSGSYDWGDATRGMHVTIAAGQTPVRAALRVWPSFIAPPVHVYLLEHLTDGVLQQAALNVDFDGPALDNAFAKHPPADKDLHIDFTIGGATLHFLSGVPPLTGADAVGHVTGHTVTVSVAHGELDGAGAHKVFLSDGTFIVPDTTLKPSPAEIATRLTSGLDSLGDILSREGFKSVVGGPLDLSAGKGQVDGHLTVDIKLDKVTRPADTRIRANAAIADLSIDKLIGKERFEQGQLALVIDKAGMRATGQGKLFGSTSQIEFKKTLGSPMEASVTFQLDDAARTRVVPAFAAGIKGLVLGRVSSVVGQKEAAPAQVELDFAKCAFDNPLPGLVKAAGRPAKTTFRMTPAADGAHIDQLIFESTTGASARGAIDLDANGSLKLASLSTLRLSPGDDMSVHVEQGRDAMRIVVRGQSVDARPFLRGLFGPDGQASGGKESASLDMDIDLKASLVTGNNNQALSNVDMKMSRRGGIIRDFETRAKSGRASVTASTGRDAQGTPTIEMDSTDGGALLSFVDLYRHMEGGRLRLSLRPGPRGVAGALVIRDLVLRDEPALRRLVAQGTTDSNADFARKIDTTAAPFQRLSATFIRDNGALHITDGVLFGTQIGIKMDGVLDFPRDHVDMTGTFVPVYGLNNLFTQIPLVGPLLGGNHEGLFAVNFRVAGRATAPNLILNPLSAIAPGFLRKIFGPGGIDPTAMSAPAAEDTPATIPAGQ